ncbi:MAG: phosphatase PAP2 family protein [Chloroflexi bacterium]|nr:phosphatase PAP2 family protein [Chloroflexota bacterium]
MTRGGERRADAARAAGASAAPGASSGPGATPAADTTALGARNQRLLLVAIVAYVAVISGLMIAKGVGVTPDLLLVGFGLAAVVLGRGRLFFRDWVPFIALFFAYELLRGFADDFGMAVHVTDVIALDRLIGFGTLPTEWLQRWLHPAAGNDLIAMGATIVYFLHFPLPLGVGFLLWIKRRALFYDFVAAMIVLCVAGFVTFLFLPTAPPWWAAQHGFLNGPDGRPLIQYLKPVGFDELASLMGFNGHYIYTYTFYDIGPDPVAAFPSLHAAFPFLAFLFARRAFGRIGWAVFAYFLLVVFSIVYLGDHYVTDAIAGVGYAVASYALVAHAPGRLRSMLDRARDDSLGEAVPAGSLRLGGMTLAWRSEVGWRRVGVGAALAVAGAALVAGLAARGTAAGSLDYAIPAAMVLVGLSAGASGLVRR